MNTAQDKSNIIVRSVELRDGKETIVEEMFDDMQSTTALLTEEELCDMFDSLFPDEENK